MLIIDHTLNKYDLLFCPGNVLENNIPWLWEPRKSLALACYRVFNFEKGLYP